MERSEFLKRCSWACLSGISLSAVLQGCSTGYYIPFTLEGNQLKVKKTDFVEVKKDKFLEHHWVLVQSDKYPEPIYLRKGENDSFTAVLLHCQHKGCEVKPGTEFLVCPCHGSEYTAIGKVVQGPSERDLQKFRIQTDADYLYIEL